MKKIMEIIMSMYGTANHIYRDRMQTLRKVAYDNSSNYGLLALCNEVPGRSLFKRAAQADEPRSPIALVPGHLANTLPGIANVYGAIAGAGEGHALKGSLLGAQGVQGARDKEQGVPGQNLERVLGTGLATGAVIGGGVGAGRADKAQKLVGGIKGAIKGGLGTAAIGGATYGLGSYFTDNKKDKK